MKLKNTKISFNNLYEKLRFPQKKVQISNPIEIYFQCIATCDVRDDRYISGFMEILQKNYC